MIVPADVVAFATAYDVVTLVASANRAGRPSSTAAVLPRFSTEPDAMSLLVGRQAAWRVLADLDENPLLAVNFTRVPDCTSYQGKGRLLSIAEATEAEREQAREATERLTQILWRVNPFARQRGAAPWFGADLRITLAITSIYTQSPGPSAGAPLTRP